MRWILSAAFLAVSATAQTPEALRAVIERLGKEADLFDKRAHRVTGIETLRQTLPRGSRISKGKQGIEVVLPEQTREIVSEYGFVSLDEPGGWMKEVRKVVSVDGLKWKKGNKSLDSLALTLSASDDKKKRSLLESFEHYGLQGFITDLGQLILLFARGLTANYEITFDSRDLSDPVQPRDVYRFSQLGGTDALTVYEGKMPLRLKLEGRIWVKPTAGHLPVRISLETMREESTREGTKSIIRDLSSVEYEPSQFGCVLPARIRHQQLVDDQLFVEDDFTYSNFKSLR